MSLTQLKIIGQIFCRVSSDWFVGSFHWSCISGRIITRVKLCSFCCIPSGDDLFQFISLLMRFSFDRLIKVVSAWHFHCKVTLSHFSVISILWGGALQPCKYPECPQTFNLFIYLFISVWTQDFLFYLMGSNLLQSLFVFMLNCPFWLVGTLTSQLLCFVKTFSHYPVSTSLLSGTTRCPKRILCFPCPSSGFSHLSEESWLLLVKNGF